jgi:hypothetical protein
MLRSARSRMNRVARAPHRVLPPWPGLPLDDQELARAKHFLQRLTGIGAALTEAETEEASVGFRCSLVR